MLALSSSEQVTITGLIPKARSATASQERGQRPTYLPTFPKPYGGSSGSTASTPVLARSSSHASHNHRTNPKSKTLHRESRKRQRTYLPTYTQRPKEVHRVAQRLYQCLLGRPHKLVTITGSIPKARPAPASQERGKCRRHTALGTAEVLGAIQSGWTTHYLLIQRLKYSTP